MNRVRERQGRRGTEGGDDLSTDEHHYVSEMHTCTQMHTHTDRQKKKNPAMSKKHKLDETKIKILVTNLTSVK